MKEPDDLFVLIKSLTRSEKRYLKIFAAQHGSQNETDYMLLFDVIDEMEEYDDALLRSSVREETRDHLPQLKYYLYRTILRALNRYHSSFSVEAKINELLQAYRILYEKGLYGQCRKLLAKARRLAMKHDSSIHLLQIFSFEYRLAMMDSDLARTEKEIGRIFDELVRLSSSVATQYRYWRVQARMFLLTKHSTEARMRSEIAAKGRKLLDDLLPLDMGAQTDPFTILLYLFTHENYCTAIGAYAEACQWGRKIIAHIESVPSLRERVAERYIPALHNLCLGLIRSAQFDEFTLMYEKLKSAVEESHVSNPGFNDFHIRMLAPRMFIERGDFVEAARELEELNSKFPESESSLRVGFGLYFNYLCAYSYFGAGEYRKALPWINTIIGTASTAPHGDLQRQARILNLIIHYELGNIWPLESYISSTVRYLSKRGTLSAAELIAIDLLRKLASAKSNEERTAMFTAAKERLIGEYRSDPAVEDLSSLDLMSWIDSRLEGRSFAEIVQRNSQIVRREAQTEGPEFSALAAC